MGFINPKTGKEEVDFYQDPEKRAEYARYMANLPKNDTSPNETKYWTQQADTLEASKKGHTDATAKAMEEIQRRLAERDARRR
jgi:hypothetical protein